MSLFNFNQDELLCFFAVLVRFSVLIMVLPFVGDSQVPGSVKALLSLAVTLAIFPSLLASGTIRPADAAVWSANAGTLIFTVAMEAIVALILGYTARLAFDSITFGGNLIGNFMGFGIANTYDPNQQSHTQVISQIYMAIAMLLFLAIDGHHVMLKTALSSYQIVGLGGSLGSPDTQLAISHRLIVMCGEVLRFGVQISAPIAIVIFSINVVFGMMARAVPQLNILVLSVAVSGFVGLLVMFLTIGEFQGAATNVLAKVSDWMDGILHLIAYGK